MACNSAPDEGGRSSDCSETYRKLLAVFGSDPAKRHNMTSGQPWKCREFPSESMTAGNVTDLLASFHCHVTVRIVILRIQLQGCRLATSAWTCTQL